MFLLSKYIFFIFLFSVYLFSAVENFSSVNDAGAKAKLEAPLENIFKTHEMDLFLKEFKISLKFGICCEGGALSCRIGFKAHMIEPVGYLESSQIPLYFPFANIRIDSNPVKGNTTFNTNNKSAAARGQNYPAHFIYFPLYGIILGKKLRFTCFHQGDLTFPYLSEFDPTWKNDAYYNKMMPQYTILATPSGILTGIFDCVASEIANVTHGYSSLPSGSNNFLDSSTGEIDPQSFSSQDSIEPSVTEKTADMIRDTMYYMVGCQGMSTIGGYVSGDDYISDLALLGHTIIGWLHSASALSSKEFFQKQTNAVFNTSAIPNSAPAGSKQFLNTMCSPKKYPLPIASQYVLQLAYPTVGSAKEIGVIPAEYSTAKGRPSGGNAVYVVWMRRDYYAFAYLCPNN